MKFAMALCPKAHLHSDDSSGNNEVDLCLGALDVRGWVHADAEQLTGRVLALCSGWAASKPTLESAVLVACCGVLETARSLIFCASRCIGGASVVCALRGAH